MRQGIGFVSYADPKIADKALEEDHTIDGKKVEFSLESTTYCHFFLNYFSPPWFVSKEDILFVYKVVVKKALDKTTRIYVGDFPLSLTQGKEYT